MNRKNKKKKKVKKKEILINVYYVNVEKKTGKNKEKFWVYSFLFVLITCILNILKQDIFTWEWMIEIFKGYILCIQTLFA